MCAHVCVCSVQLHGCMYSVGTTYVRRTENNPSCYLSFDEMKSFTGLEFNKQGERRLTRGPRDLPFSSSPSQKIAARHQAQLSSEKLTSGSQADKISTVPTE